MLEIDFKVVILSSINFLLLYFILKKMFFSKIIVVLEKRKNSIKEKFEKIQMEQSEIIQEKEALKKKKSDIVDEGKRIIDDFRKSGMESKKEIIQNAMKEAAVIDEKAKKNAEEYETQYFDRMRESTVEISAEICKRVLGDVLDERTQGEIIDAYIERLEKEDV